MQSIIFKLVIAMWAYIIINVGIVTYNAIVLCRPPIWRIELTLLILLAFPGWVALWFYILAW